MKQSFLIGICLLAISCSTKSKPVNVDQQLKSAMTAYLNADPRSKGLYKYDVKSVVFFDNTTSYICEFKVHMTTDSAISSVRKIDTTGDMKVKIDKNFKVISRYY